jgi:molecular chaperone GrpE
MSSTDDWTLEEWKDYALRSQADLANARRRAQLDLAASGAAVTAKIIDRFLPLLDAIQQAQHHEVEGADALLQALQTSLTAIGVERRSPVGEAFDPVFHEAVAMVPAPEGAAEGTVVACFQEGYVFGERVIRAARVSVAGG